MSADPAHAIHTIDLIRKKRDGGSLEHGEIAFCRRGGQLLHSAWNNSPPGSWLPGSAASPSTKPAPSPSPCATPAKNSIPSRLGKVAVDKHSTGGVGDKTSFLVAPIAAACGVAVPMISGRALGHTGGTLDKLESIPGYRTALSLAEFETVLDQCGASIVSQTPALVPADRVLYALRDRTGTVENPGLICASILSKKLAAGLNALVLDVKTGSGAFLRKRADSEYLAALMVATAEAAGTRTVALLTDMGQPLGAAAGNWIEIVECVELLRGQRPAAKRRSARALAYPRRLDDPPRRQSPDRRDRATLLAEAALADGSALAVFFKMIDAHGGDVSVFDNPASFHKPGATAVLAPGTPATSPPWTRPQLGWAVQRTGAGREKAGETRRSPRRHPLPRPPRRPRRERPAHRHPLRHHRIASSPSPSRCLASAISISDDSTRAPCPSSSRIFTRENAEAYLAQC